MNMSAEYCKLNTPNVSNIQQTKHSTKLIE